ncbi:MAG: retroviral-like aspartic protease family protein [Vampirovibrio sp.]|nr:retroviral-like aspartic protease family protein [Vampirovibrio sp.]
MFSLAYAPSLETVQQGLEEEQEALTYFQNLLLETQNPLIASMARENLIKLKAKKPALHRQVEVPILKQNHPGLRVHTLLNKKVLGTFLVDTGATHTLISPELAKKIGVKVTKSTPTLTVLTANGPIEAPLVTVDRISIGGVEVTQLPVVIQPLGNDRSLTGLLGMNFFKNMELTLRDDKLILGIYRKQPNRKKAAR